MKRILFIKKGTDYSHNDDIQQIAPEITGTDKNYDPEGLEFSIVLSLVTIDKLKLSLEEKVLKTGRMN